MDNDAINMDMNAQSYAQTFGLQSIFNKNMHTLHTNSFDENNSMQPQPPTPPLAPTHIPTYYPTPTPPPLPSLNPTEYPTNNTMKIWLFIGMSLRQSVLCLSAPQKKENDEEKAKKEKKERKKKKTYWKNMELLDMDYDELTLGAKGHYYPHAVQYQEIWQISLGYADEARI